MTEIITTRHSHLDDCSTEVITPLPVADEPEPDPNYLSRMLGEAITRREILRDELTDKAIELSRQRVDSGGTKSAARLEWTIKRAELTAASLDRNIKMLRKQK